MSYTGNVIYLIRTIPVEQLTQLTTPVKQLTPLLIYFVLSLWIAGLRPLYDRHSPLAVELNDLVYDCYSKKDD